MADEFRTLDSTAWRESLQRARDRRAESVARLRKQVTAGAAKLDLEALERKIAYSAARSDIETMCCVWRDEGANPGWWYDTQVLDCESSRPWVDDAVRYLELRGLLLRSPNAPHVVRPLDEPEAKGGV